MCHDKKGRYPKPMHRKGGTDLTVHEKRNRTTQPTPRAPVQARIFKRTQGEVVRVWI